MPPQGQVEASDIWVSDLWPQIWIRSSLNENAKRKTQNATPFQFQKQFWILKGGFQICVVQFIFCFVRCLYHRSTWYKSKLNANDSPFWPVMES